MKNRIQTRDCVGAVPLYLEAYIATLKVRLAMQTCTQCLDGASFKEHYPQTSAKLSRPSGFVYTLDACSVYVVSITIQSWSKPYIHMYAHP